MKEELSFDLPKNKASKIKVFGVGGGGTNAVNYMYNQGIIGVDFVVCNTDAQALDSSPIPTKIQLGVSITEGLGAGANPEVGEQAAIETLEKIKDVLETNTKMIFITAGMGGGTGTGAAPIIAKCARDMGILTVGIVTVPFQFEGEKRLEHAQAGLEKLRNNVDSLIVINNNKLRELYGNLGYKAGFAKSDEILSNAAKGIAEIITQNYQVNIDLNDVKKVLSDSGTAIMGSSTGEGPNRAQDAISKALDSPLLNDNKITGAKNVLLLIVSGKNEITMDEIAIINEYIQNEAGNKAHIIMGIGEDQSEDDKIMVMVVATGFQQDNLITSNHQTNKKITVNDLYSTTYNKSEPPKIESDGTKVRYLLDDEEEKKNKIVNNVLSENSESFEIQNTEIQNFPTYVKEEVVLKSEIKEEIQSVQTELFDSKPEIIDFKITEEPKIEVKQEPVILQEKAPVLEKKVKVIGEYDDSENVSMLNKRVTSLDFSIDMEQDVERTIQERREKLRSYNTRYQTAAQINELEKVPAYLRSGISIESTTNNSSGFYFDSKDGQIKPNHFLNKNID